jgi:hypothetical protein
MTSTPLSSPIAVVDSALLIQPKKATLADYVNNLSGRHH